MSPRLRPLALPFLVEPPRGIRVRTRLQVTDQDALVLWALGLYVGCLANHDLALRCAQGNAGGDGRRERKRALTGEASSRWAGAITRTSNDQWQRAWLNLRDRRVGLQRAIAGIETRLGVPVGERRGGSRGYASQAERFQKQRPLQMRKGRLAQVEARLAAGRVSVTRGGRELARMRHNLEAAGLSRAKWRERWEAERLFITTDGEADKYLGNETIRWHPEEQWLELKLPDRLGFLANRPHGRYRLDCQVSRRGKRWRRTVAGLPTARFRDRLVQMCSKAGLSVVAVDPAYTTRWGEAHWRAPLDKQTKATITVSRHQAAAVLIGRRSLGHRARRRPDVTDAHRRMGGSELSVMPNADAGCPGPWPTPEAAAHPSWGQDARPVKGRCGGLGHRRPFAVARWTVPNVRC